MLSGKPTAVSVRHRCASRHARVSSVIPRAASPATEAPSLAKFQQSGKELLSLLRDAARNKSVDAELVEGALVALEKQSASPKNAAGIPGRWRLVYSTSTSIRAWQYIPVKEDLVVDVGSKAVSLESEVGPFAFDIRGTIFGWNEADGVLDFQFDRGVAIKFLGNQIWEVNTKGSRKTYTFFYADSTVSAARSSAGGLSLLLKL